MTVLTRRGLAGAAALLAMPSVARAAPPMRIGFQKIGSLVIMRQQRTLEASGMAVEWVEFGSGPPMLEAINAGAVDVGAVGDTPPIFAQAAGVDMVYVGAQDVPGANTAILVRADGPVRTVADLRGRRVAYTRGSSAHAALVRLLAHAGLTPSDIQPVLLQPADAGAAFRTGAVDAWSIWDPFFAMAEAEPGTRVLTTAEGIAPSSSFVIASRAFARGNAARVRALLDAVNGAADWARANPDALAQTLSAVTGVPLAAQRVAAARGFYAVGPMDDAVVARQQSIADTFATLRLIPARIDVRAAVWRQPDAT